MISNIQQKVTDKYRENPFWDIDRKFDEKWLGTISGRVSHDEPNAKEVLDFEQELANELRELSTDNPQYSHGRADRILIEALKHLGWDKLVAAYKDTLFRCDWP